MECPIKAFIGERWGCLARKRMFVMPSGSRNCTLRDCSKNRSFRRRFRLITAHSINSQLELSARVRQGSRMMKSAICIAAALLSAAPSIAQTVDFSREVLPILSGKCFVCHGPDADKKHIRLDSREAATKDLGGYRAIDPAALEKSEILKRIHDKDDPMPPEDAEKQLTEAERDILARWVRSGGDYQAHWAYVPPKKPDTGGKPGAIDGFLQKQLAVAGIEPAPEADRATLARRAALVLTGLPPAPEELAAFLADASPDAYGAMVDRLLDSPRFGEHQARQWLDAVRYGDTHGLHLDNRRGIYPYRDWVVMAFNDRMPLNEFLRDQLAGDLLPEPTLAQLTATGFVRMNPSTGEGGAIPAEFQAKNNFDRVETMGTVLLGASFICARCHTHKYDPVTQTEYYRLLAFFNSTEESPLDGNKYDYAPVAKVPADQNAWQQWKLLEKERAALTAKPEAAADLKKRTAELEAAFTTTLVARELLQPRPTRLLSRGEYDLATGDPLEPGVPAAMGSLPEGAPRNRLGLAQWITARDNPLVARVLVNRLWSGIFGAGLVRTAEDFGLQGEQPTHPELLDWLAVELHDSGWNLKHMLRLMVTSRAFKQDSRRRGLPDDLENRMVSHGPSWRLDAEVLRDVALWSSELMDPHMGGEGVKPDQPPGLWTALAHPGSNTKDYVPDTDARVYRRSLYVYWKRTSPHPMMSLFDAPSRESSCVRRSRSSTPTQSLGLLNERQRVEAAHALAARLLRNRDSDSARLDLVFTLIASRAPVEKERAACLSLLDSARRRFREAPADAAALLKAGHCGRGDGLDPVEHAAWAQVAAVVLASDAAILLY